MCPCGEFHDCTRRGHVRDPQNTHARFYFCLTLLKERLSWPTHSQDGASHGYREICWNDIAITCTQEKKTVCTTKKSDNFIILAETS